MSSTRPSRSSGAGLIDVHHHHRGAYEHQRADNWDPSVDPPCQQCLQAPGLLLAAAGSALALLPIYLPYRRAAIEQHLVRSLDIVKDYSATPMGYLAAAGRIHFSTWSGRFFKDPVDSFFPGVTLIVLGDTPTCPHHPGQKLVLDA